jgi:hypothetical protein
VVRNTRDVGLLVRREDIGGDYRGHGQGRVHPSLGFHSWWKGSD